MDAAPVESRPTETNRLYTSSLHQVHAGTQFTSDGGQGDPIRSAASCRATWRQTTTHSSANEPTENPHWLVYENNLFSCTINPHSWSQSICMIMSVYGSSYVQPSIQLLCWPADHHHHLTDTCRNRQTPAECCPTLLNWTLRLQHEPQADPVGLSQLIVIMSVHTVWSSGMKGPSWKKGIRIIKWQIHQI